MFAKRMLCTLMLAAASACGGGDGPTGPAAVATITVTSSAQTIGAIGESVQFTAVAKDAKGGALASIDFTWSSSDPAVATVVGGLVTAVGNGTASIRAVSGAITGTMQVTVQQTVAQIVVASPVDTLRALADTARATATVRDARGNPISGKTITWTSATPSVLSIDGTGLMTAVTEGAAIIRATVDAVQGERTMQVRQRASMLVLTRQPAGARAGVSLTTQPRAELQDARGSRVTTDNTTIVTATIASGGGSVVSGATATASAGIVTFTSLAIGGLVGPKSIQLAAPAVSSIASDAFTLAAGDPAAVVVVSGNNQTGLAGTSLSAVLQAGVRDGFSNGIANAPVSFVAQAGGGTVATALATTDASGNASTAYTLSRFAGASTVVASSSAVPAAQATFTATATPNGVIRGTVTSTAAGSVIRAARVAPASGAHRRLRGFPSAFAAAPLPAAKRAMTSVASTAAPPEVTPRPEEFVPGELMVTYRASGIDAPAVGSRAFQQARIAGEVSTSIREAVAPIVRDGLVRVTAVSPAMLTALVTVAPGVSEADAMARLRADPRVLSVERNGIVHTHVLAPTAMESLLMHSGVGDVGRSRLDQLMPSPFAFTAAVTFPGAGTYPGNTLYASQAWHYNTIALPQAWSLTQGSNSVLVAVVDDGMSFNHPAMAGVTTADGYDFVPVGSVALCAGGTVSTNGDGDGPDPDPTQPSSRPFNGAGTCVNAISSSGNHGLHVAGTIGAVRNSSAGVVGVNWQVRIRPVRVLGIHGSGSNFTVAQGVLYAAGLPADNGAGGTVTAAGGPARIINMSLGGSSFSTALATAVEQALANGTLVVASAGNSNSSTLNYPASYPDVISVSAVGPTLNRASYSSYGSAVKIAAPGGQVSAGYSHGVLSSAWDYVNNAPIVDSWNGTSMAAPHVSGVAALVLAREPGLTVPQLRQRLLDFSVDIGAAGRDDLFGQGLLNARNSLTSTLTPTRSLFVRLVNATTGAVVRTVAAGAGGTYEFGGLADGSYWVFAGHDDSGDGLTGMPLRAWGALGSAAEPTAVVVAGADVYPASFSITTGFELEPNGSAELADELLVDGYINGDITTLGDQDFYRLRVVQAGNYDIRVTGQLGACRFALEADPILSVFTSGGATLASSDDIDAPANDFCSQAMIALTPGDYVVRVGGAQTGRYVVSVRKQ